MDDALHLGELDLLCWKAQLRNWLLTTKTSISPHTAVQLLWLYFCCCICGKGVRYTLPHPFPLWLPQGESRLLLTIVTGGFWPSAELPAPSRSFSSMAVGPRGLEDSHCSHREVMPVQLLSVAHCRGPNYCLHFLWLSLPSSSTLFTLLIELSFLFLLSTLSSPSLVKKRLLFIP